MRIFAYLAGAIALFAMQSPVQAQVNSTLSIAGNITGTRTTVICPITACTPSETFLIEALSLPFNFRLMQTSNLVEGDTSFSELVGMRTLVSGTINNTAGIFTGRNLEYSRESCSPGTPGVGCTFEFGRASSFYVIGGIPEASTWAMMLIGFGAIGYSMRRRPRLAIAG